MIGSTALDAIRGVRPPRWRDLARIAVSTSAAALSGAALAYLVARGLWYVALALLLALPAVVLVLRYPLATIVVWFLVTPFVSVTDAAAVRQVFWLVHRALPLGVVLVVVLGSISRVDDRRLPRLGWPEVLMAGYVVASILSIAYTSSERVAVAYLLYDRVVVPMCLYLIVRLLQPSERSVRRLWPVALVVLLGQTVVGIVSWVAPGVLPSAWLSHVGTRTVGTFSDPDVFGTTVLLCGLLLFHVGGSAALRPLHRVWPLLALSWAFLMTFLTFSRGNWLAGLVVLAGVLYVYRRHAASILAFLAVFVIVLLASDTLTGQVGFARDRLASEAAEESAIVRLPVAVAAVRMFADQPLVGWGYDNFDRFSRQYQTRVGDLVSPEKPHSSHNLFLTILAEQGVVGIVLFVGPMLVCLRKTRASLPRMPIHQRQLVTTLWLAVAAYVIVNNFSVMKLPFGLGLWWLTLGLIASYVYRYRPLASHRRRWSLT